MTDDDKPQPLMVKKSLTAPEMFKLMLDRVERHLFFVDTGHWPAEVDPDKVRAGIADDLIKMAGLHHEVKSPTLRERYEDVRTRAVDWLQYTREFREALDMDAPIKLPKEMKDAYERA